MAKRTINGSQQVGTNHTPTPPRVAPRLQPQTKNMRVRSKKTYLSDKK